MTAQKSVLQLTINEKRIRTKAFKTVSGFSGVTSVAIDDKTGKMTVVGEVDVPKIVMKLRKICHADIVSVDAVKPPEKKPEPEKSTEFVPYTMNYPYPYYPNYANYYYQPYVNC